MTLNLAGAGYTLVATDATTPSLPAVTSNGFTIATIGTLVPSSYLSNGLSVSGSTLAFIEVTDYCDIQPQRLLQVPTGGGTVTTLASGLICPKAVLNDGTNVYWIDGGTTTGAIKRIPVGGGAITTLATGLVNTGTRLMSDGTSLFFVSDDANQALTIRKIPRSGGAIIDLVTENSSYDIPFTIDGGTVYYHAQTNNGTINRVSTGGGSVTTMTTNYVGASYLVVSGTTLYWSNVGLFSVATSAVSTMPTTLVASNGSTTFAEALATDGASLYVVDQVAGLLRYDLSNFASVTTLAAEAYYSLALDSQSVYFAQNFPRGIEKTRK